VTVPVPVNVNVNVTARGGGASRTDGCTHVRASRVTISTDRLTAINIDDVNNIVMVEPGAAWATGDGDNRPRRL